MALSQGCYAAVLLAVVIIFEVCIEGHHDGDHLALRERLVRRLLVRDGGQGELSSLNGFGLGQPGEVHLADEFGEGLCFEERARESFPCAYDKDLIEGFG
jgi:hypothetical protein